MLARKMFTKDKFIADYNTAYDVYFYVKSDTRVANNVFDNIDTTNKRMLKKSFMSGMKKTNQFSSIITKLYQKDRINEGFFTLDFYPKK